MVRGLRLNRKRDPRGSLADVLGEYELPSFPRIVSEAIQKISGVDVNLAEVGELLGRDPGVSTKLLTLVNSTSFAPRRPIDSVTQAVTMLGRNQVESLLISLAVRGSLPSNGSHGERVRFWMLSARRAVLAAAVAEAIDPASKSATFTAALLQDMALPVLSSCRDGYRDVAEAVHASPDIAPVLEQERFGWHHGEVGAWMGQEWNFPEELLRAIEAHHDITSATGSTAIAAAASLLTPDDNPEAVDRLVELLSGRFGLDPDAATQLIVRSHGEAGEIAALFT